MEARGLVPAAALLLAVVALLAVPAAASARMPKQQLSELWGIYGEKWSPRGPIMDFSFAGYRQGSVPLPEPPATVSVEHFREKGMSDTKMLQAALKWAHEQPATEEHLVLEVPEGRYTLKEMLFIHRPNLILRGAGGSKKTTFVVPKSLADIYGMHSSGGYVFYGAFVTFQGKIDSKFVAQVEGNAERGDTQLMVQDPSKLEVGQIYIMRWKDVDGQFANSLFDYKLNASVKSTGTSAVNYANRVTAIDGKTVNFERPIPYYIWPEGTEVRLYAREGNVTDSGLEGFTFEFKWELYGGHHHERGWNAVEFNDVYDCWARDIHTVNADNGVVMTGSTAVTVQDLLLTASGPRSNRIHDHASFDGHWGVHHTQSFDLLVNGFRIEPAMYHGVGSGSAGMFSVFTNGWMHDGNLELHRALAGPCLFTDVNVGYGTKALYSGGPVSSGPSTQANTTYWNVRSVEPILPPDNNADPPPGDCAYGVDLIMVGMEIIPAEVKKMCNSWRYEPEVHFPPNLYEAQLRRRLGKPAFVRAVSRRKLNP